MSRIEDIRLGHVRRILNAYRFEIPFHHYLKNYFRENKQIGSKDRKLLRQYTYYWFRLGMACKTDPFELRLAKAVFLNELQPSLFFDFLATHTQWVPEPETWTFTTGKKLNLLRLKLNDIFPWEGALSEGLNEQNFIESLFRQPNLWLRVRKGKEQLLEQQLSKQQIPFERYQHLRQAYALPNGSNAETEGLAEVQDLSSLRVTEFIQPQKGAKVWDCCAASGGKSLALADKYPEIHLYVSDIRARILENLQARFRVNEVKKYATALVDLSKPLKSLTFLHYPDKRTETIQESYFDLIIVDAPCSGSGTWARSPEQLQQMDEHTVSKYASLQRNIVQHASAFLKNGGQLVYVTCSVFAGENEKQAEFFTAHLGLQLKSKQLLQGTSEGADSMFVAILNKP